MVKLGQNFLVDRNILDVIERLANLGGDDVVLEVGGGQGILSTRLAQRVGFVHVVELDDELEGGLRAALAPFTNAEVHMGDALTIDFSTIAPPPDKIVANLPYGVAATVILRTIFELPSVRRWVVMVQREVGERFAAAPGTGAYGVPSVLAQLACDVKVLRPVSRQVFRPVPNVDSVLLGLTRTGPAAGSALNALVHGAFAHRRKTLAGSLALTADGPLGAEVGGAAGRDRVRAALTELGHPPDVRAERLSPRQFRDLAERLSK